VMPPDVILENTVRAVQDMARQVLELRAKGEAVGQIYSCRFNSGLFHVDWKYSKAVLEKECAGIPELGNVVVVRPKGEKE
jgi:ADP-ribose 1''-phosphate phosphatase